jgi:predicted Zn-dependent protease
LAHPSLLQPPSRFLTGLVTAGFLLATVLPAMALPRGSTPRELELGEEASEDIAKAVQLVEDPIRLAMLQSMLDEIAVATERPDIEYRPHIVKTPMVNAFVVPGGWVYVTTGLLDSVESEHELAGVMAHEIAHNVNQHAIQRMHDAPRGLGLLQLAAIAALIIGRSPEAGLVASAAASTITAMVLQGGSVSAEVEADREGIEYLAHTHYDPTGALTFHERMASTAGKLFEEDMGIYRTHPFSRDRVLAARAKLEELGIPVHRRLVTKAPQPQARETVIDGREVTEINYRKERLLLLDGHDADRSKRLRESIGWALDRELTADDMKIVPALQGVEFAPGNGPRFFFTREDGRVNGHSEVVLAGDLRKSIAGLVADETARIQANSVLY